MITALCISIFVLVAICLAQRKKLNARHGHMAEISKSRNDWREKSLSLAEQLAENSSLNAKEIMEAIVEQNTTVQVDSDVWSMPLPYGKWEVFPDEKGQPPPEIKGFWAAYPGRLIGVKMPEGSEYDMHFHPWVEILIGGSGVVWVEIEQKDSSIARHRLGPEDVVVIPPGARHAVARAESKAVFVCIWGHPIKDSHD